MIKDRTVFVIMYKIKGFREKVVCVIVSTSRCHVCWSVVTRGWVFLAVLSNLCQKNTMADFGYKSLRLWKIDNIDLTKQFSLPIFTDFRYQSIKITWLLQIFIDTDFYRLTTPGINAPKTKNWLDHTWIVALVTVVLFYGTIFLRNLYAHQIPKVFLREVPIGGFLISTPTLTRQIIYVKQFLRIFD